MMKVSLYRDGKWNSTTHVVSHVRLDVGDDRYVVTFEDGAPVVRRVENPRNEWRRGDPPGGLPSLGPEEPREETPEP